jgi:hypothetical protein
MPRQPSVKGDGFALPGVEVKARIRAIPPEDYDMLGRLVREEWVRWAREQPNPKPSWLVPWEDLSEPDREVDRRIGRRLAHVGAMRYLDV